MRGRHFYFTQNVWKHINEAGLRDSYSKNIALSRWLKSIMALSFVPKPDFEIAFECLTGNRQDNNLQTYNFSTYFCNRWMNEYGTWNHSDTIGPKTNNYCDGLIGWYCWQRSSKIEHLRTNLSSGLSLKTQQILYWDRSENLRAHKKLSANMLFHSLSAIKNNHWSLTKIL
mgnify:CR=1 FL=1